jgi:hypothetical protein
MSEGFVNILFYLTYVLIAITAIGVVYGITLAVAQNFKEGGVYAVVGLVVLAVLFGIGYALSPSEVPANLLSKGISDLGTLKFSSAGLITFYALSIIAVLLVIIDIVKGIFE